MVHCYIRKHTNTHRHTKTAKQPAKTVKTVEIIIIRYISIFTFLLLTLGNYTPKGIKIIIIIITVNLYSAFLQETSNVLNVLV